MIQDMKTTLTRLFTVMMLIIVSMGAMADVKVLFGEKGTELQPAKDGTITLGQKELTGGTIIISQEEQKDGTTKVTFAVTPDKSYKLAENGLEVYAVIPTDISPTRGLEVSTALTLKSEDYKDEALKRTYTTTIDSKLNLWLKSADFQQKNRDGAKNGKVSDGIYYIRNNSTTKGYLWPSLTTNSTTGYRYLTTSLDVSAPAVNNNNSVSYAAHDKSYSHWVVKNVGGYIQLINPRLNKYVVIRSFPKANNTKQNEYGDRDVWLTDEPAAEDIEYTYFVLNNSNSPYKISPKPELNNVATTTGYTLNSAAGNDRVFLTWSKTDGKPYTGEGREGLIQLSSGGTPLWSFTPDLLDAPTFSNPDANSIVTVTDANSLPDGYNIRYTTDGTDPTASSPILEGSRYPVTSSITLKAVVERYGLVLTEVATKVLEPAPCATPIITFDYTTSEVSITCATNETTIYYTTDGTVPTAASSTPYNAPFLVSSPTTVKAIATHTIFPTSAVAELAITQVATPTIQKDNGSNAISITTTTPDATIYYTTDGSDPSTSSTKYTKPLTENVSNVTIKAIAVKENMITSAVGSGTVILQCATPVITRYGTTFSISCKMPTDATFYYSLDGSTPTTLYSGPVSFTIDQLPMTVTAVAKHNNYTDSESATFELKNGQGTPEDPYLIYSDTDFANFVSDVNAGTISSACYKLMVDVSASGVDPITTPFTGTFEAGFDESSDNYGNFYKITGLRHALFNTINGGKVRNVILDDVIINNQNNEVNSGHAGAICNEATGTSRIYNCGILPAGINRHYDEEEDKVVIDGFTGGSTTGNSVGGSGNVGSIVGRLSGNSRVINCFSYANITGGDIVAGIVGNIGNTGVTQNNVTTVPMVVNCMFYGDITSGGTISPVYGGSLIKNDGNTSVNGYNYFRGNATFDNNFSTIDQYKRTWPADEEYLTRFEYYRSILNSNRQLCTYWVTDKNGSEQTAADTALIAKWVLDPSIAPYPILKKWGKYPSVINRDSKRIWDPRIYDKETKTESLTPHWVDRDGAPDYHGKKLGTLKVTINPGGHAATGVSAKSNVEYIITDMDTLNCDYGYAKIQLPYYNEVFGDPTVQIIGPTAEEKANQWKERYGGNYTDYVVTGWDITSVTGGTAGTFKEAWEDGYNFADRKCTEKDKHRTFAQGGYYYVPEGVTNITITAHWGQAVYLRNADNSVDRVNVTNGGSHGTAFAPAGTLPNPYNWTTVTNTFASAIVALGESTTSAPLTVYDQAIVLAGNYQKRNGSDPVGNDVSDQKWHPFTVMSADFDMDNEPDYCMQWQFRSGTGRPGIQPIRFDFLPVVELGLAIRHNNLGYAIGVFIPQGHFEITETAYMHTTQFEYDGNIARIETQSPLILNGGNFEQIVVRYGNKNRTSYILMGGNFRIKRFTPGYHATPGGKPVRHCAVNAIGGEYPEFYLSGIYRPDLSVNTDNPHCYTNGGYFGLMAGAGYEQVNGDITFKIDHSIIGEFYGGGINAAKSVTGKVDVTIDHSLVTKYCGGPKVGILGTATETTANYKTVTTQATGTTFGVFYGGGNGGTSYYRDQQYDNTGNFPEQTAAAWTFQIKNNAGETINTGFNYFYPLNMNNGGIAYDEQKGYHAEFEFEIFKSSNGLLAKEDVIRAYINWAQFGTTTTGNVKSTLTDCIVKGNFYGGGNLANVSGKAESILKGSTHVYGSAYGGGFSASIPSFRVHNKSTVHFPEQDFTGTIIEQGSLDYVKDGINDRYYKWSNEQPTGVSTNSPTFQDAQGNWYCYTPVSLSNLGAVLGDTDIKIEGSCQIDGSVYGGGEQSGVDGNTVVTINNGTIGTSGLGGAEYGNVYGGGKGKAENEGTETFDDLTLVKMGLVKGSTNVTINGGDILHNVYGGGAFGSVGTYTYDGSGNITEYTSGGTANVTITGGTIGTTGQNNGMVFGSSRGDVDAPGSIQDRLAWVHDTHVIIGTSGSGTVTTTPLIMGSVYGSGENGHTYQDAIVYVHSGTIGITSGVEVEDDNGNKYQGAAYPYRGNVYGGGCGTDTYWIDANENSEVDEGEKHYNPLAGIVRGTATVNISGGQVVHNVYGAGAMGSVGNDADPTSGKTTVNIRGGRIGYTGERDGNVFGAARGEYGISTATSNLANVRETEVNISYGTTPSADKTDKTEKLIAGSVFGGGESGTVKESVAVNMTGGLILKDIYGGGALADTQTSNWDTTKNSGAGGWAKADKKSALHTTTVRATGGRVVEEIFGGGLGEAGTEQNPTGKPAYVWGDVLVELNKDVADDANGCVVGQVFGCNNINGTPKGDVKVHICKTQNVAATRITNPTEGEKTAKVTNRYDVNAVYGGGNQSAYEPADPNSNKTEVIIDGCDRTSIQQVYGGGNAACTPATNVTVNGTFEILELFGGGNGLSGKWCLESKGRC